jgi:hypothetical protein
MLSEYNSLRITFGRALKLQFQQSGCFFPVLLQKKKSKIVLLQNIGETNSFE